MRDLFQLKINNCYHIILVKLLFSVGKQ